MDVIADLAYPLPLIVIAEMIGVPREDREQFKRWSDDVIRTLGFGGLADARRALRASRELRAYFRSIAEERRREPRDDLMSGLLAAEDFGTAAERLRGSGWPRCSWVWVYWAGAGPILEGHRRYPPSSF